MKRTENRKGSARQLPDGTWECIIQSKYINPKTGNMKRIKRKGVTEAEARENCKDALTAWEKQFETGKDIKVNKSKTFGDYMKEYIDDVAKQTLTASGYHSYVRTLHANFYNHQISHYQLQMLSKKVFDDYYKQIYSEKSRKTCGIPVQLCRRCLKWILVSGCSGGLLKENYAEQAKLPLEIADEYDKEKEESLKTQKKVFSTEDIQKFYYAYKNNMGQYPVVVLFLLETGMRTSEFAALTNDKIDIDKRRIDIVSTRSIRFKDTEDHDAGIEEYVKVPKNKEARFIMMSDLCVECVLYMQEQTKLNCPNNPDNLLYPTFRNGKMRSNSSMEVCFKSLCDKLGIDRDVRLNKTGQQVGLCLHSLRHTADTIANTQKGANVVNTALKLGHKAIEVENVYTHATEEALSSVVTPSQAVLDDYKKNEEVVKTKEDKELYEMYMKLKQKFGDT